MALSAWSRVEFASAVSLKVQIGQRTPPARAAAMAAFSDFARGLVVRPIASSSYDVAVGFLERLDLVLRRPDALHLAVCAELGDTLVTRDRRMATAAAALGVSALLL